ncbi:ferritin-like protein [Limnoraphis robusta Tam1]|nr:ferritin-like protein [Limnoraphis robusta Tam1]
MLTADDFVPTYPTPLPTGATDFEVHLRKFSPETVEMFMNIERSHEVADDAPLVRPRNEPQWLRILGLDPTKTYYSIGLFYAEVIRGMQELHREMGDALFCGDPKKQVTPEYYYDGAGEIIPVTDLRSAVRALRVIQEQGEGSRHGTIYDAERELSHYQKLPHTPLPSGMGI